MRDPVFRALVELRRHELGESEDQFCTQCHSAICTRGGECVRGFEFESLSPIALEGVTCEACHKVSALVRPFNAGHELDEDGPIRGPIIDPIVSGSHNSSYSPLFDSSEFCGGCHDVIESSGLMLEQPYAEWLESPANPAQTCQSCHMPTYVGQAAIGGPEREALHHHWFVGVDLPMEGDVDDEMLAMIDAQIEALLDQAVALELALAPSVAAGQQLDIEVTTHNLIAGHAFPTGSTFIRQAWLELRVTDAEAKLLYETGQLDSKGDLRDHWSSEAPDGDPDLIVFGSKLTNGGGRPELFSWRATAQTSTAIPPLDRRTHTLHVQVPEGTPGPLQVDATVHFRAYPPFLLRQLGLDELVELAVVRDIAQASAQVDVAG